MALGPHSSSPVEEKKRKGASGGEGEGGNRWRRKGRRASDLAWRRREAALAWIGRQQSAGKGVATVDDDRDGMGWNDRNWEGGDGGRREQRTVEAGAGGGGFNDRGNSL